MDWNKGYEATIYATVVDRETWRDTERFEVENWQITRSNTTLIEAADIDTNYEIRAEQWIRLRMIARQNGAAENVALFTGLASAPQKSMFFKRWAYSAEAYSVLKPAEDVLLPRGYFVPEGADSGEEIRKLLKATPAPVEVAEDMPRIRNTIIAEQGENCLSMTWKILQAANRRIRIEGDGTIRITEKAVEASVTYDAISNDSVEPTLTLSRDWFSCPNVFRAIEGNQMAVARDDDPESDLSTVTRGREVWMEEDGCSLSDREGIEAYAERRLKEEQSKGYEVNYARRFHPDITISDLVGLHYPAQGLDGEYKVIAQQIAPGSGCRTEEQVEYC